MSCKRSNNRLLNLVKNNTRQNHDLRVKNEGSDEATLYIYDVLDEWWGISAEMVAKTLQGLDVSTINVRINSPGGDVFVGRAIQTALAQHPARIVAHIDGLAASAASFITTAADEILMTEGGFYMIHKSWSLQMGNADDMRQTAYLLDQIDASLVKTYATRTGQSEEDILAWMTAETWFNAEDAKEHKFIDGIFEAATPSAENASRWNLNAYSNSPNIPSPEPKFKAARAHLERRLKLLGA